MNMKMKLLVVGLMAPAVFGCTETEEGRQATVSFHIEDGAKEAIKEKLRDPTSAEFSEVRVSRKSGMAIACGKVNSNNGLGGKAGTQRFISNGGNVSVLQEEMDSAGWSEVWSTYC